jgi:hypothetical protein
VCVCVCVWPQINRQGILVQNIQERLGQQTQLAASMARVAG